MHSDEHISGGMPALAGYSSTENSAAGLSARRTLSSPGNLFAYAVIKRVFDVGLVLLFAPLWIPLCLAIALCVVLTSPGPVFFSHRRIGRGGVFFSMWKFRTMCTNSAEVLELHLAKHPEDREEWANSHKLKNDPRITPLGRFLRQSSLDEMPQLWNVLTGRMTLVGPRPIVAAEAEKYGADFCYYLAVKPGITGLWQTSGRSTLSYDERVALDRRYVEHWSMTRDVNILLHTVTKVANSDGAY
jgi:lipopolysaccharide/colanic/teichoic acid biosynthesis glycosyltransferase